MTPFRMIQLFFAMLLAPLIYGASAVQAQTQFAWPAATQRDLTQYTDLNLCDMWVRRIRDSAMATSQPIHDTTPLVKAVFPPLPSAIVQQANLCISHFSPKQDAINDASRLFQLFLLTGRDADARELVAYQLAKIAPEDTRVRARELVRWLDLYLSEQPPQLIEAEPLYQELVRLGDPAPIHERITGLLSFFLAAQLNDDTVRISQSGRVLQALVRSLSAEDRKSDAYKRRRESLLQASLSLTQNTALDSLARNTAAYLQFLRGTWRDWSGEDTLLGVPAFYGAPVPPITGDWVYPGPTSETRMPAPGKINLMMSAGSCMQNEDCLGDVAALRRIAARFPEVAITITFNTAGVIGPLAVEEPEEEAKLFKQLIDAKRIPATVSVTKTAFWRRPDPDNRPVYHAVERKGIWQRTSMVLTDRNGLVVYGGGVSRRTEEEIVKLLTALHQQPR